MHLVLLAAATLVLSSLFGVQGSFAQSEPVTPPAVATDGTAQAPSSTSYTPVNADGQIEVVLKNHVFQPSEIRIPPNKAIQLLVKNQDATADEFDSTSLRVEKVIGGGNQGIVRLRPLQPGRYPFMGEFHADTAQGVVIVE